MSQHYSDPTRELLDNPHALPDVEVFYVSDKEFKTAPADTWMAGVVEASEVDADLGGWYYWFCFPGCLPDSEPVGPFETRQAAVQDAQEG